MRRCRCYCSLHCEIKKKRLKSCINIYTLVENWKNVKITPVPIGALVIAHPQQKRLKINGTPKQNWKRTARILSRVLEYWGDLLSVVPWSPTGASRYKLCVNSSITEPKWYTVWLYYRRTRQPQSYHLSRIVNYSFTHPLLTQSTVCVSATYLFFWNYFVKYIFNMQNISQDEKKSITFYIEYTITNSKMHNILKTCKKLSSLNKGIRMSYMQVCRIQTYW